ncbi:MAG: glycosyltransferase [Candidatus Eisenbacteria bacterium]|nr:glycosyltransferase [Candidatus Eisenbacteria bacterium]
MRRTSVLFLIESLNLGGSEVFLSNLLARLDQSRFRPIVCCLVEKGKLAPRIEARGFRVVVLGWRLGSLVSTVRVVAGLVKLLREEHVELVQTFFHRAEILGALAGFVVWKPIVVGSQYDVIVPNGSLSRFLLRMARLRVRHVVANCQACRVHRERLTGQAPEDISVIYAGLAEEESVHDVQSESVLPDDFFEKGPVVTFAGRLYRLKGPDVYLKAAASVYRRNPGTRFLLIGEGPMRDELVSLAEELGLSQAVHFVGEVPSLREVFSRSSVVVLSSRSEGFPTSVLEAMAVGVPVVASRTGGVEELINDRVDGFLFESENSEDSASIITMLLSNREIVAEVGARAREKVTKLFRFDDTVAQIESLYARLLKENGLRARALKVALAVGRGRIAGTERHVLELARAFDRGKVEVTVFVFSEGELVERLRSEGFSVIVLRKRARPDFFLLMRLAFLFRRASFDVVHGHPERIACLAAKLAGVPAVVMTYHLLGSQASDSIEPNWFRLAWERLRTLTVDFTIAVSQVDARVLIERFNRGPERVRFIANGVALSAAPRNERERTCREFGLSPGAPLLCTAARLSRQKGLEFLIRAMRGVVRAFPEAVLLVVGQGELEAELKNLSSELGLSSHIIFTGYRGDVLSLVASSDLFVLPSLWEGTPYALLEAMSASRPIVTTTVSSHVVSDGRTGLVVPPSDPAALAEAITRILRDPELAVRMGKSGRERLETHFSAEKMAKETLEVYNSLLTKKRPVFQK